MPELTTPQIISIVIFIVVFAFIISEKIHRTTAALAGAVVLILTGIVTFDVGMEHIDFGTLGVLVGMMIFVAVVKQSGIFEYIAIKTAKAAKGNPWIIMVLFCFITAILSAFLDNVTTVLLVGPVTFTVCKMLKMSPVPYFIVEIMASNIGGTLTLIGDPPNIMIGMQAGLSMLDFIVYNGPAIFFIMIAAIGMFYVLYGRNMSATSEEMESVMHLHAHEAITNKRLFHQSVVMTVLVALAFVFHSVIGVEPSVVALTAAAIMLIISAAEIEKVLLDVEWATIGFFAGLFIVVGGLVETGVIERYALLVGNFAWCMHRWYRYSYWRFGKRCFVWYVKNLRISYYLHGIHQGCIPNDACLYRN